MTTPRHSQVQAPAAAAAAAAVRDLRNPKKMVMK